MCDEMIFSKYKMIVLVGFALLSNSVFSAPRVSLPPPPGEGPALADNLIEQADIEDGEYTLKQIRKAGGLVFSTPFNRFDGLGDGPPEVFDDSQSFPFRGDRPTLQTEMTTMLRINGLDSESCVECHAVLSRAVVPATMGVGGHGGINDSPMPGILFLELDDPDGNGIADTTGRVINPPFIFGAGGVELLAKEMTRELQLIKATVEGSPTGTILALSSKGVSFGVATSNGVGNPATVSIENGLGIDEDLVVRPFGRKGEFFSVRDFDRGAMAFHMGIQVEEVFGAGTDPDGDGITDELTIGEMSALSVFLTTLPPPSVPRLKGDAAAGDQVFKQIGCASCHISELQTESKFLTQSFPDIGNDPDANIFMRINLAGAPTKYKKIRGGGLRIPLFADLKRHDMGAELAETTGGELDPFFTTARLWGIADSAPYLHDGRAATLTEAILAHGGEAQTTRENFEVLSDAERRQLLTFLRSLKLPNERRINKVERLIRSQANSN